MPSLIISKGDRRYNFLSHYYTGGCRNPKEDDTTASGKFYPKGKFTKVFVKG